MSTPRFSVIIPTFNRSDFLREALESVVRQSFRSFEVIVVDDGSTDDTREVLDRFKGDALVLRQSNQGGGVARNLGASAASGEYFAFLDDDDLLFPWALGTYDKVIRSCGEPALVVSHLKEFSGASPLCEISEIPSEAEYVLYPTYLVKDRTVRTSASMMVVHRSAFEQAGGFQNGGFDDVDFLLKVSGAGPAVLILSPRTVVYRWHGANAVRDMERAFRGIRSLIRTERAGGYQGACPRRFDRYAFIGGPVFFWSKKAFRLGFPLMALRVLIPGMPMILAGGLRRGMRWITGFRQPNRVKLGRDAPSE